MTPDLGSNPQNPIVQAITTFGSKLLNHPVIVSLDDLLRVAPKITKFLLCCTTTPVEPPKAKGASTSHNLPTPHILDHEDVGLNAVAVDQNLPIFSVQIGTRTLDNILLDGGLGINVITEEVRAQSGLPKPQVAPYRLRMAD